MEIFPGIFLYDLDVDLEETITDINEISNLPDSAIKWKSNTEEIKNIQHFGIVNFNKIKLVNEQDGQDVLTETLSNMANSIFSEKSIEYAKNNYVKFEDFDFFVFFKYSKNSEEKYVYEDVVGNKNKRVALKYFINDDYKGGEVYFPRFNITVKPKKNQLLIYPSNYVYGFIEKPVLSGTKYQLSTWF
jgi:hypothetical protein